MPQEDVQPNPSTPALDQLAIITSEASVLDSQLDHLLGLQLDNSSLPSHPPVGISLLDLKNHLLLSYVHNLINLIALRISQTDDGQSNKIVAQLVWLRLVVEKLRPMEARLKYQIEKLLKTVKEVALAHQSSEINIDHIVNDPLSFKPNPSALEVVENQAHDVERSASLSAAREAQTQEVQSVGVYRPPRVAPMAYPATASKSKRPAPAPIALREAVSLSAAAPQAESTTGLSNTAARSSGRAKALARMNDYEEANMMRLFSSKKDARRRRDDEAAVALGIEAAAASTGRAKRRLGALEGEFAGVLGDISRQGDRYSAHLGHSSSHKPSKQIADHSDAFGTRSSGKKRRKSAFNKAVAKTNKQTD